MLRSDPEGTAGDNRQHTRLKQERDRKHARGFCRTFVHVRQDTCVLFRLLLEEVIPVLGELLQFVRVESRVVVGRRVQQRHVLFGGQFGGVGARLAFEQAGQAAQDLLQCEFGEVPCVAVFRLVQYQARR